MRSEVKHKNVFTQLNYHHHFQQLQAQQNPSSHMMQPHMYARIQQYQFLIFVAGAAPSWYLSHPAAQQQQRFAQLTPPQFHSPVSPGQQASHFTNVLQCRVVACKPAQHTNAAVQRSIERFY
jgi:hypothetical protein